MYLHLLLCISINRTELVYFVLACYNLTGGTVCIASSERLFGEEPSGAPTFLIYFNVPSLPFLGDQAVNCYAVYGSTPLCFLMQLVCEDGTQYKSIHAHPDRPIHVPGLVQMGSRILTNNEQFFFNTYQSIHGVFTSIEVYWILTVCISIQSQYRINTDQSMHDVFAGIRAYWCAFVSIERGLICI